jgi:hypothetical protein
LSLGGVGNAKQQSHVAYAEEKECVEAKGHCGAVYSD